jgi:RHS repeat-associated protein
VGPRGCIVAILVARGGRARVSSRLVGFLTSLALAVTSLQMAPPAMAASAPQTDIQAAPAQPAKAPGGKPYKLPKAKQPTEIVSKRTAYSDTYDNHDGTYTATVSSGPINYLDPSTKKYLPIDTTLSAMAGNSGRVRAGHMATPVEVGAADDASGFVSMDTGKGVIRMFLAPGAKPGKAGQKPVAKGPQASVAGLMDDIDLQADVDTTGIRTFFILNSLPATSSFSLALDTGGLTPSLQADGSIQFLDKKGNLAASMPRPFAEDSDVDPNVGSGKTTTAVSYSLQASGKQWLLTVSVDPAWLTAATYPVYVDPSVVGTSVVWNNTVNNQSAYINLVLKDMYSHTGYHEFLVGYEQISQYATYLRFDLAGAGIDGDISSVTLDMYPWHQWYTSGERTWIKKVTTSWDTNTITWNNAPFHSTPYPTSDANFVGNQSQWTQNASWTGLANLVTWARDWVSSPSTNYGIYLYGNQSDVHYWKRFTSSQSGSNRPSLEVTYTVPTVAVASPVGNAWTNNRTLSWTYGNASGFPQTESIVQVATDSGFANKIYDPGWVGNENPNWAIPSGVSLTNGSTYYWRVQVTDGYGGSDWSAAQFRWDTSVPAAPTFTAPAGNPTYRGITQYNFTWSAVSDPAGIISYDVIPQSGPVSSPGVCSGTWTDMSGVQPVGTYTYFGLGNLVSNTCYRVAVRTRDSAQNASAYAYSYPILTDGTTPSAPVITDDCPTIGSCYRTGNTIYFQPDAAKTITLTSTGVDTPSRIASSSFGALSDGTGWTYSSGAVSGNPASKTLTWSADAVQTTLSITVQNGAGTSSQPTVISFVPDPGAKADFAAPISGTTTTTILPGADFTVSWTETQGLSPLTGRSLQRWSVAANSEGTCPTSGWATQGDPTSAESPVLFAAADISAGTCYRWVETLTDSLGPHDFTSAPMTVDATDPTASLVYPTAGQPLAGNLTVTGTAADTYLSGYILDFGAGTAPSDWTTIATSSIAVPTTGTLGTWVPGPWTGVYTLRLRVTDQVGNSTTVTRTVYLANTDRGVEAYNSSEDFDLGGGWTLGVNVATGEATLSRGLFSIPSYGPGQSLTLVYDSSDTGYLAFGRGWSSNLTQYLDLSALSSGFIVWHRADGAVVPFGLVGGTWTVLSGHYETLILPEGGGYLITSVDHSSLSFDSAGRLAAMTDRFGTSLTLAWGSSSASATDASGHHSDMALDTSGRVTSVTDSAGRAWSFTYGSGNLTALTDPAGNVTNLGYDASGQLTAISRQRTAYGASQPASVVWGVSYDASGKVTAVTDPIGGSAHQATFTYSGGYATGTTTVVRPRDASGVTPPATTTYTLDGSGRGWATSIERSAAAAGDPDANWTTNLSHDANGNLLSQSQQIDATHYATTTWTYDAAGNVLTETDPIGIVTSYTYDSWNDMVHKVVAAGSLSADTAYVYDATHRLCREIGNPTVPVGDVTCTSDLPSAPTDRNVDTRYGYDGLNQMTSKTDPLSIVTAYAYDGSGNQISVTRNYLSGVGADNATNVTTSYTYDAAGNATSETSPIDIPDGVSVTKIYTYDALGNGLIETDPGDTTTPAIRTVNAYDEFGAQASVTTQACVSGESGCSWLSLSISATTYNAAGFAIQTVQTTPATGTTPEITATTTYAPDLAGDVLSTTDADGVTTSAAFDALGQKLSEIATGGTTTHRYDGLGDEVQTVAPGSATASLTTDRTFDAAGHQLSQTQTDSSDQSTSTTTYALDAFGRVVTKASPDTTTTQTYDRLGQVTTSVNGTSGTDTAYDRDGNAVTISDPYDSTDPNADKPATTQTYDALGRLVTSTHAGVTEHTYYDAADDVIAVIDGKGHVTRTFFNIAAQVTKTIVNCTNSGTQPPADPVACAGTGTADSATNVVTTNEYSPTGGLLLARNFIAGMETDSRYDGAGRVISKTQDVGGLALTTSYSYDSAGRQITETDPRGVVTRTVYDGNGHVCRSIQNLTADVGQLADPCTSAIPGETATANVDTRYQYDDAGNKTHQIAQDGADTHYVYDGDGNLTSQIADWTPGYQGEDPTVNATTTYAYDDAGRQRLVIDPAGAVTATVYDADGHVCREIHSGSIENAIDPSTLATPCTDPLADQSATDNVDTQYTYDAAGSKTRMIMPSPADGATPASTVITLYAYDTDERLCRVVENAGPSLDLSALTDPCHGAIASSKTANVDTQYGYDDNGNMTSQFSAGDPANGDPAGTTSWTYDTLDRLSSQTDALGNTTHWSYDAAGNKASQSDPDGQKTYWLYDAVGRLCRRIAFQSISGFTPPSQPCAATSAYGGAAVDTLYGYDPAGNQISAKDLMTGQVITAAYDALARPTTVNNNGGPLSDPGTAYTYGIGQLVRVDPGATHTLSLDHAGRQTGVTARPAGSTTDLVFSWTYGATGITTSFGDPTGNATTYGHDTLGRLVSQSTAASGSARASYTYSYNASGNRIGATGSIPANAHLASGYSDSIAYTYDPLGRLLTYSPQAPAAHQTYAWNAMPDRNSITVGSGSPVTTSYDAAERPVSDASHASDAEGRVTMTPGPGGSELTLSWDPLGRLTSVSPSTGGTATYTYDPLDRLSTISSGSTTTSILYVGLTDAVAFVDTHTGSGDTYTCRLTDLDGAELAEYDAASEAVTYLGLDPHGDTVWTSGSDGLPAAYAVYDPLGNLTAGSLATATRWQGSWQDTSTGLYYVVARWYDPLSGRFLSEDPVDQAVTSPQDRDPYAYGAGDSVSEADPYGRCYYDANTHLLVDCATTAPQPSLMVSVITTVVGRFTEPPNDKSHSTNTDICGAGALRVVLAFMNHNPEWQSRYYVYDPVNRVGRWKYYPRPYWRGAPDPTGSRYMLYLAYEASPPGASWSGTFGYLPNGQPTNFPERIQAIANWEYSGWDPRHYYAAYPFVWIDRKNKTYANTLSRFVTTVEKQIRTKGVPVQVGLHTRANASVRLPSWTKDLGHYVPIVGYDASNFYYIDTCAHGYCRTGPYWSKSYGPSKDIWRIPKLTMYNLMEQWWKGGFLMYMGPRSSAGAGY